MLQINFEYFFKCSVLLYSRFSSSAMDTRVSTIVMESSTKLRSVSVTDAPPLTEYRYSNTLGAIAWMYGVQMIRSGWCRMDRNA